MMIKKDQLTRYKQTQVYAHKEQLKQVRVMKIVQTSVFFPFGFWRAFLFESFYCKFVAFFFGCRLSMSSLGNDDCNSKGAHRNVVLKKNVRAVVAIL